MTRDARSVYTESALRSLPRLLSLQDRNPLSPAYGCFHRDYWLYKTSDFPDAVRQFAVHALALVYAHDLPGNIYRGNPNVRDWAIAGLDYWTKIQHADGSFDEFYPYERGWVGPTAFTTYAAAEAYQLLRPEYKKQTQKQTPGVCERVEQAIRRAAQFIVHGESEEDHLANHHAMAVLAVATAADALDDDQLRAAVPVLWQGFLRYQDNEGWSLEYDGADPGYLSATVSFLAKALQLLDRARANNHVILPAPRSSVKNEVGSAREGSTPFATTRSFVGRTPRPPQDDLVKEFRSVLAEAVDFASYFVYPDGSYAGTIGSRNTVHCYPHGFELLAPEIPMAAAIAERIARGLADGKLVPPEIMSDRYVHYRVPEFLLAAIDAQPRPPVLAQLPYERPPFVRVFPNAGIAAAVHGRAYTVANLAKGGVIKSDNVRTGQPNLLDTGWLGELADGRLVTSQWIDPGFHRSFQTTPTLPNQQSALVNDATSADTERRASREMWSVSGTLRAVPPPKLFTLWTHLAFRAVLVLLGWHAPAAHWLKGRIRTTLILGSQPVPCSFTRTMELTDDHLTVADALRNDGRLSFRRLLLGGDIPLRYVPQSRFFQPGELKATTRELTADEVARVNRGEPLRVARAFSYDHTA